LFPSGLTWIAHKVGVGRGADLLLYILVVTFGLVSVILFRRLDALERKYVAVARMLAIQEASRDHQAPSRSRCASGDDADG
jgi:hypothetical protein